MLKTLRKNPFTKQPFSAAYRTIITQWGSCFVYDSMFQEKLIASLSYPDPTCVFGDSIAFIQLIKIICYLSEYKASVWVVSNTHDEQIKRALLEMDLQDALTVVVGFTYLEALSTTFTTGYILCFEIPWAIVNELSRNIKMVVVGLCASDLGTAFLHDPHVCVETEWLGAGDDYLTKVKDLLCDITDPSCQVVLAHQLEIEKLCKHMGHVSNASFIREPRASSNIIVDGGRMMRSDYHYASRCYRLDKQIITQDILWNRKHFCKNRYILLLESATNLRALPPFPTRPITPDALQLLANRSPGSVRRILSKYHDASHVDHALKTLYHLGAINSRGSLTRLGQQMQNLQTDPQIARMLVKYGISSQPILYLGAALHLGNDLRKWFLGESVKHEKWIDDSGDHASLLRVILAFLKIPDEQRPAWCHENMVNIDLLVKCVALAEFYARQLDIHLNVTASCDTIGDSIGDSPASDAPASLNIITEAVTSGFFLQTLFTTGDGEDKKLFIIGYTKPLLKYPHIPDNFPLISVCSNIMIIKHNKLMVVATPVNQETLYRHSQTYFTKHTLPHTPMRKVHERARH